MANLKYKTRNNSSPQRKPRVYFCCHPKDFDKYFAKISDEILAKQNCAIWYTDDTTSRDENFFTDLGQMQLFVMPITSNLLSTENEAINTEFKFATENHIPVLPLMQESNLEELFNKKCGDLQFLDENTIDTTAISYTEKLDKYLKTVLIGDALYKKIRAAFDAYVFLSYRKKDRKYAQELMRLIHKNEFCRDIAIWYDEFLTPGENFNDSIKDAIQKSGLFVLTVTPNLVNETNYIMTTEYPMAKQEGKPILPAELVPTDREKLFEKYADIPSPADAHNDAEFSNVLLEAIKNMAIRKSNRSPEHNFFIGLAYLSGIDVEVDREKALALITSSAEEGLPEAMQKLFEMYTNGVGVKLNYSKAVYWAKKLADYYIENFGEEDKKSLSAFAKLMNAYTSNGEYPQLLSLAQRNYKIHLKLYGDDNEQTLYAMQWLASSYNLVGEPKKSLEFAQKAYDTFENKYGENHIGTISLATNLANAHQNLGNYENALTLHQRVYEFQKKHYGESNLNTLNSLASIAQLFRTLGEHKKSAELFSKIYEIRCEKLGKNHPKTLISLSNIASTFTLAGDYKKSIEIYEEAYSTGIAIFGEKHPHTLDMLNSSAVCYMKLGEYEKSLNLLKNVYDDFCNTLGAKNPKTILALQNIGACYIYLNQNKKALEVLQKAYEQRCEINGPEHEITTTALNNVSMAYMHMKNYKKAMDIFRKIYDIKVKKFGKNHLNCYLPLNNMGAACFDMKRYKEAAEYLNSAYAIHCNKYGNEHPVSLMLLSNLAFALLKSKDKDTALKYATTSYEISHRILKKNQLEYINAESILAIISSVHGKHKKALELIKSAYKNGLATLGPDHYYIKKYKRFYREIKLKAILHGVW